MKTTTLLFVALAAIHTPAPAQLFKCTGKDGKVTYQAEPCPETATEKSVKPPAAGPDSAPGNAAAAKEGWTPATITNAKNGCVEGGMRNARLTWERTKRGTFPESEYQSSSEAFCSCLARRVSSAVTLKEFAANADAIMTRYGNEAVNGGECRPTGILAKDWGSQH
ncbi:MAG TPA: DUF4124 domain-containing protein [Usitatibacter sp.]|nr:DUF4124 domain-containing protein [Usitatibacter sp.]